MAWKYVMFQDKHGRKFPVIFPEELVHAEIAHAIPSAYRSGELKEGKRDWDCPKAVNAGFIEGLVCVLAGGKSESLEMESSKEDTNIINSHPYSKGLDTGINAEPMVLLKTIELLMKRLEEISS